jgi:hypothetical protein
LHNHKCAIGACDCEALGCGAFPLFFPDSIAERHAEPLAEPHAEPTTQPQAEPHTEPDAKSVLEPMTESESVADGR